MLEVNLEDVVVGWRLPRRSFLKFCPSNWTSIGWQSRLSPISKPGSPKMEKRRNMKKKFDKNEKKSSAKKRLKIFF